MSTSGTRRRRSAAVVSTALLGMSVALAGCGVGNQSSGGGGGAAEGGGQIRATWWGGDSENQALNAALDRFTEAGGVEVARETQAWDGYWDRLATQTAGRNAPDLIMQAGSQIPDYAGRGALLDLNEVDGLASDVVDEGLQDFGAVDGELYGVVAAANAMGLVTNDELLADAGVSLPDGPYDWT